MVDDATEVMRALVCGPPCAERDAMCSLIESSDGFVLVAVAQSHAETVEANRNLKPDILVIDEALSGGNAIQLAQNLALQRPLPILVLVEGETPGPLADGDLMRRLRIYQLGKAGLRRGEAPDLELAATQLYLLRARTNEAKRTITRDRLSAVVEELLDEEDDVQAADVAERITREPLELIVVAGGAGSSKALAGILAEVTDLRVPVVAALAERATVWDELAHSARPLNIHRLDMSLRVRWSSGIFVAFADQSVTVRGEIVDVLNGSRLDIAALFASMAVLGASGLSVLLTPTTDEVSSGLLTAARRGGHTAMLRRPAAAQGDSPSATQVSTADLARTLSQAVPKRI